MATALEIARKFAEYGEAEKAQRAYSLFLGQKEEKDPKDELEAASYIFFSKGDYRTAYTVFVSLYNRGLFQDDLMNMMVQAFYLPNIEKQKKRYAENQRLLEKYPYFFHSGFLSFEDLPILFFPYDDDGFLPFYRTENRFGDYINFNNPVIDRWFFKDLEKPMLAEDVYSQYQLEYLCDTVRKSEWAGRENHVYLHYTDWAVFCSYLQCLSFKKPLREEKFVFLFGGEIEQYPIDFKERFGMDYSRYQPKPIQIEEINRLIWHAQLSSHNGGDFFNEVLAGHPQLLALDSIMFDNAMETVASLRTAHRENRCRTSPDPVLRQLSRIKKPSDKDLLVAMFLTQDVQADSLDPSSRIAPALLFQPHFSNVTYTMTANSDTTAAVVESKQVERLFRSPVFRQFKYIKTFVPMRRPTTSYAASVRFALESAKDQWKKEEGKNSVVPDAFSDRLLSRGFLIDPSQRAYRDSALIRFEDGKLNPKAAFTALAEFLDIPYTESMTYCSNFHGERNPETNKGNVRGFDPASVYKTYDEYADDDDRALLEYFLRDVYEAYGYGFHYYHGEQANMDWVKEKLEGFQRLDSIILESHVHAFTLNWIEKGKSREEAEQSARELAKDRMESYRQNRLRIMEILLNGLRFSTRDGQPMRLMKLLELDPALLEQPLYH